MAVDSPRCQHIALLASDLEIVRSFHRDVLGLELANYLPNEGVLAFQLRDGFVLPTSGPTILWVRTRCGSSDSNMSSFGDVDDMFDEWRVEA